MQTVLTDSCQELTFGIFPCGYSERSHCVRIMSPLVDLIIKGEMMNAVALAQVIRMFAFAAWCRCPGVDSEAEVNWTCRHGRR